MRFLRRLAIVALTALATALRAAPPFAQTGSDLTPDPAAHFYTLPNDLRVVVRANAEPKNRASLRLLVNAGSLHEADDQRGLAHFLEHMAFNGSTHYAPGTLVERLQRLGMSFGADTNASTGFDRTVYLLELPDTKPETLAEGLQIFADYAAGLLLPPAQIDKERGIVLSEKRAGDSVDQRTAADELAFTLAGTRFPQRFVIGQPAIIEKAARPAFADFYDTWYRPERMAVVAVGDFDPAALEKQIATVLSGLKAHGPARPDPDRGKIADPRAPSLRVHFHPEPEAAATSISISTLTPYAHEPDDAAHRARFLRRHLAVAMLNRRLEILAQKENAPFTGAGTGVNEGFDFYREASFGISCQPVQWRDALAVADQELRRALEHGFQPAEFKEILAWFSNALEQTAKSADTRHSDAIADRIVDTLVDQSVFTSPEFELALWKPELARITVDDCTAAFRTAWAAPHRYILVSGNAAIPGDAVAAITAVYEKAHAVPVSPAAAIADAAWTYTDFGPPGKVAKREHIADLDADLVTFANGVRLNLKKTDFEKNIIRLNARLGTGKLTEPRDQPGLAMLDGVFLGGGLGRLSYDDVKRVLAGKTVGLGFDIGEDAVGFGASTNRDDLLLQLQVVTAAVTDPGYRPEALRIARKGIEETYTGLEHTLDGPINLEVVRLLHGGDTRFGLPSKAVALSRTLEELKAWLTPQFATGPIEVALVGDLDVDAAIDAVGRTLGALPSRMPKPPLTAERAVKMPAQPFAKTYSVATEIPTGSITVLWPTTDARDIHRARRLDMLADILADRLRLKIREALGDTYSPNASSQTSDNLTDYGFMTADVTVDPAKAASILETVVALGADLAKNGVTTDELTRAREPALTAIRESRRDNGYWLNVLADAQEKPEGLDWARSRLADIESITPAELAALAKTYLTPERAIRITVLPKIESTPSPLRRPAAK